VGKQGEKSVRSQRCDNGGHACIPVSLLFLFQLLKGTIEEFIG
jgi:hypothetical protein